MIWLPKEPVIGSIMGDGTFRVTTNCEPGTHGLAGLGLGGWRVTRRCCVYNSCDAAVLGEGAPGEWISTRGMAWLIVRAGSLITRASPLVQPDASKVTAAPGLFKLEIGPYVRPAD
jgi:hypothetical protein